MSSPDFLAVWVPFRGAHLVCIIPGCTWVARHPFDRLSTANRQAEKHIEEYHSEQPKP